MNNVKKSKVNKRTSPEKYTSTIKGKKPTKKKGVNSNGFKKATNIKRPKIPIVKKVEVVANENTDASTDETEMDLKKGHGIFKMVTNTLSLYSKGIDRIPNFLQAKEQKYAITSNRFSTASVIILTPCFVYDLGFENKLLISGAFAFFMSLLAVYFVNNYNSFVGDNLTESMYRNLKKDRMDSGLCTVINSSQYAKKELYNVYPGADKSLNILELGQNISFSFSKLKNIMPFEVYKAFRSSELKCFYELRTISMLQLFIVFSFLASLVVFIYTGNIPTKLIGFCLSYSLFHVVFGVFHLLGNSRTASFIIQCKAANNIINEDNLDKAS